MCYKIEVMQNGNIAHKLLKEWNEVCVRNVLFYLTASDITTQ